jgi:2'-5' RNA ligase
MGIAVECYFTSAYSSRIERVWNSVSSMLPSIGARPHFSLAVFDDVDTDRLLPLVQQFASCLKPFELQVSAWGIFPTVPAAVYLSVVVTEELLRMHGEFHRRLDAQDLRSNDYYKPGSWIPHITIDQDLDINGLQRCLQRIASTKWEVFGMAQVCEIGVIRFRPVEQISLHPFAVNG